MGEEEGEKGEDGKGYSRGDTTGVGEQISDTRRGGGGGERGGLSTKARAR